MQADDPILVLCTAPDDVVGARLARELVERRLAACVNMIAGVRSFYRWEGTLHADAEVQLIIKSRRGRFEDLRACLNEHHPYDVPEVLALPIVAGSEPYLEWMAAQTHAEP